MTGYGIAKKSSHNQQISVEIRSLNSKNFELKTRLPAVLQAQEHEFKKMLQVELVRGKVDFTIHLEGGETSEYRINRAVLEGYLYQLSEIAGMNGFDKGDILLAATRLPNVVSQSTENSPAETSPALLANVMETVGDALAAFLNFRHTEGAILGQDIQKRVQSIVDLLAQVSPHEAPRTEKVRQKLIQHLAGLPIEIDQSRLAQELIFYIEKFDLSEERTRLAQHCVYFLEVLNQPDFNKGNKLGFIAQEMGREINTLGSKANSVEIQHLVVQMKEELEKIKEQIANVL